MTAVKLYAPVQGWCAPLEEVPDAAFAQGMLGPGIAIDPTNDTLHAPCDGELIAVASARHAVTIRSDEGIEVLMHVGIDTVSLAGTGFEVLANTGDRVRRGDPLLRFDLDVVARGAKSLITPIVIANGERFEIVRALANRTVAIGDELLQVRALAHDGRSQAQGVGQTATERVVVAHEHGIHARPAAELARCAKQFNAEIRIEARGRSANARSAVALMGLGVRQGDEIDIVATGADAKRAARAVRDAVLALEPAHGESKTVASQAVAGGESHADDSHLRGVIASRGFAVGRAVVLRAKKIEVEEAGAGVAHETAELERARGEVRTRLQQLARTSARTASEVIAAHLELLDDCELIDRAQRAIAGGKSAGFAWRTAIEQSVDALRGLDSVLMNERIDDLLDLESQVLQSLSGVAPGDALELPERAILIARDLKPSQLVSLDASRLAGICLAGGGPTSHVALLAAAMGIPALVALGDSVLRVDEGAWLVLDAEQGSLAIADPATLTAAEQNVKERAERTHAQRAAAQTDCYTSDGMRIEVFANLASLSEAQTAVANGAEGCGLLRTEFLFIDRASAPDEAEQLQQYQAIANTLQGRPLVIRTLDIGGDKPIPYLPLPAEDNPALGLRGVRTSLWRPDLLQTQLRAILRVQPVGQCRVLLPMITDAGEIRAVRRMIEEIAQGLGRQEAIQVGAMVETPASALRASQLLKELDFLSIGTNDLTQYTLAMDRTHAELAHRIDGLHPAVLTLIASTVSAADRHAALVAVCGGLASEPAAVPILIGLGVRELSVVPTMVPELKALIRAVTLEMCRKLAEHALEQETAEEVRVLANEFLRTHTRVTS